MSLTLKQGHEQQQQREAQVYSNFIDSLRSQRTEEAYEKASKQFMKFHNIVTYSEPLELPILEVEDKIKDYILDMVNKVDQ